MVNLLRYKSARSFVFTYGIILFFALLGFVVRSVKFHEISDALQFKLIYVSIGLMAVFWESLRLINNYLDRVMPFEKGIAFRVAMQLMLGGLVGLGIRYLIYYFGEPYLPFKLDELFLAATWVIYIFLPCAVNLGFFTVHFIERWRYSLFVTEKLEREKTQVQFDNLKNQLNPHFLFNALTSLNSLIFEDQKLASEFLQQLSKVYRYVLQNRENSVVSLDVELKFIEHYVSLLHTRFGPSLRISFDIADEKRESRIVPVTLQILIENALKHNIVDQEKPLHIFIETSNGYLLVRNNLQLRKTVQESNKQGLDNLKNMYRFLTPEQVMIDSSNGYFVVKVPLL